MRGDHGLHRHCRRYLASLWKEAGFPVPQVDPKGYWKATRLVYGKYQYTSNGVHKYNFPYQECCAWKTKVRVLQDYLAEKRPDFGEFSCRLCLTKALGARTGYWETVADLFGMDAHGVVRQRFLCEPCSAMLLSAGSRWFGRQVLPNYDVGEGPQRLCECGEQYFWPRVNPLTLRFRERPEEKRHLRRLSLTVALASAVMRAAKGQRAFGRLRNGMSL